MDMPLFIFLNAFLKHESKNIYTGSLDWFSIPAL